MTRSMNATELRPKIALLAIAKNEGAYIAEWIHHHLHFGVDSIRILVNGTTDKSIEILSKIQEIHPQVTWANADDLMARCMDGGGMFQHVAYAELAEYASKSGATYGLFMDIDEYWTPKDFETKITSFPARFPNADVIAFPWYLDVPNHNRRSFSSTFQLSESLAQNHHVKSLVKLGPNVKKILTHTAELHEGIRMLADQQFELADLKSQIHGSKLSAGQFREISVTAPSAFITHRIYRSQLEYVAILGKGTAQAGSRLRLKKNRDGYILRTQNRYEFVVRELLIDGYRDSYRKFLTACGLDALIVGSQSLVREEAERVLAYIECTEPDQQLVETIMEGIDVFRLKSELSSHKY